MTETTGYTTAQLAAAARMEEERLLSIATRLTKTGDHQTGAEIRGAVDTLRAVRRALEAQ